jgi:NAD(P)-dependent dehydrogenase (short-subunit alcohol dehydrogenase family)
MLKGKTALVTGSTSGIGLGIARALARQGADLVLNGFGDAAEIDRIRAGLEAEFGVKVSYEGADLMQPAQIDAMFASIGKRGSAIDILVNNAGIQHVAPVQDFPPERWDAVIALNLGRVPRLALRAAGDAEAQLGPHHQRGLGARTGGFGREGSLRGRQARHHRPHQGGRARERAHRHHL